MLYAHEGCSGHACAVHSPPPHENRSADIFPLWILHLILFYLEVGFLTEPDACHLRQLGWPMRPQASLISDPHLSPQCWNYRYVLIVPRLYVDAEHSDSGPQACIASSIHWAISPAPAQFLIHSRNMEKWFPTSGLKPWTRNLFVTTAAKPHVSATPGPTRPKYQDRKPELRTVNMLSIAYSLSEGSMLPGCMKNLICGRITFHSKPIIGSNFSFHCLTLWKKPGTCKFQASFRIVLIKQYVNRGSGIEHYTAH